MSVGRLFILFFFTLCHSSALASSWQSFTSEEGRFRVLLPGQPTYKEELYDAPLGDVLQHFFTWKTKVLHLSVEYSDLPWYAKAFGGREKILRKAKEGLLENESATALSVSSIPYENHEGLELVYTSPPQNSHPPTLGTARIFLVEKRLFILIAEMSVDDPNPQAIERFLTSFKLIGKESD